MTITVNASTGIGTINKDPNAVLDYHFDWTAWLDAPDTIDTATAEGDTGITVDSCTVDVDGLGVTMWISGGVAGEPAQVTCRIITVDGRIEDRTLKFRVKER